MIPVEQVKLLSAQFIETLSPFRRCVLVVAALTFVLTSVRAIPDLREARSIVLLRSESFLARLTGF